MEEHRTKFLMKLILSSFEDLTWHRTSILSCVSSPTTFKRKVNWDKYHLHFLENTSPGSFTTFCSCWFLLVLDSTSVHFSFSTEPENQVWLFLSLPVVVYHINYIICSFCPMLLIKNLKADIKDARFSNATTRGDLVYQMAGYMFNKRDRKGKTWNIINTKPCI